MNNTASVLRNDEKAIFALRSLYSQYGYSQYKMSKFEEYDLYVRNKDFLVSDNVITFTDTNGRLMALKPDVTLSIIKSSQRAAGGMYKVYYDENVYRVADTGSFKEIMQVGLECIGDVDSYNIYEVLMLAAKSLKSISEEFVLDVSHVGIISAVMDSLDIPEDKRADVLRCIGEKNAHGIRSVCEGLGIDGTPLVKLVTSYGSPEKVLAAIKDIIPAEAEPMAAELESVTRELERSGFAGKVMIDFSVTGNAKYYNGFVFKGFVAGLPAGILSGGQYDKLMVKMNSSAKAIGFAVYLDMLERLGGDEDAYDVDTVILYDEGCDLAALSDAVNMLTANGKSVTAQKSLPSKIKYKQLLKLNERGVQILENNA